MRSEGRFFAESFVAYGAGVGPNSHVDIHMASQVSRSGKRFSAEVTGMRFVLNVSHFMIIKI
jgi:hypothetical protein